MHKYALIMATAIGVMIGISASLFADDIKAPLWRGATGSTYQNWAFDTGANPAGPTSIANGYGGATAGIAVGRTGSGWLDDLGFGTKTGYWDLGGQMVNPPPGDPNPNGEMTVTVANRLASPSDSYTDIRIQVTYYRAATQAPIVSILGGTKTDGGTVQIEYDGLGFWMLDWSDWRMAPSSASETIKFTSNPAWGAVIDQVVVDTIWVPEPDTFALLFIAGIALLGRRHRRTNVG
jgi:hypothetical protein